ncbi:hypothetical protein [Pseudorhodoplanes sp.]|uniref:hypothetical protein n=1 Tax=Pseudorhodoplanes sp. TaxID=1934341 RepID=UPI00391C3F90
MTMLDFAGTVAITAIMVIVINAAIGAIALPRVQKLWLVSAVGLWIGLAAGAAGMGWLQLAEPVPVIGLFFAAPLVGAMIAAWLSPSLRDAALAMPAGLLIGLHTPRILGIFFLLLAEQGRLSGPFPGYAGWGDIATGLSAIPVALLLAWRPVSGRAIAVGWNVFGAADLLLAVSLGVTSAVGSPLQIFDAAPGSAAMQVLPWSFVPTVLVPYFLILHGIIGVQLYRTGKAVRSDPRAFQRV